MWEIHFPASGLQRCAVSLVACDTGLMGRLCSVWQTQHIGHQAGPLSASAQLAGGQELGPQAHLT